MNISGLLINVDPHQYHDVRESLRSFPGLQIYHAMPDGRLVAVLERETTDEEVEAVKELNLMDGVINAVMMYHNFEEEVESKNGP